jgi:hypothetical protein
MHHHNTGTFLILYVRHLLRFLFLLFPFFGMRSSEQRRTDGQISLLLTSFGPHPHPQPPPTESSSALVLIYTAYSRPSDYCFVSCHTVVYAPKLIKRDCFLIQLAATTVLVLYTYTYSMLCTEL